MNFEDFSAINLYDKKLNISQNLLLNDTYTFLATKGDNKERFVINFKSNLITNTVGNNAILQVLISNENSAKVNIHVLNAQSNKADVIITNLLGQEIYSLNAQDISSSKLELTIPNASANNYLIKVLVDGKMFVKQIFLN